jgi:general secretion pathway protein H
MQRQRGLTLLELLVVLAIIALSVAGVQLSLRDSQETQLTREAQRLAAMLEAARVQSRTRGVPLTWEPTDQGFVIRAATQGNTPPLVQPRVEAWLSAGTQASSAQPVLLGPEPIMRPTRITLRIDTPANASGVAAKSLTVASDGLRPFQVMP